MQASPRVHVICAPPNGRNPGMASVDLAFDRVATSLGLTDVTYWRMWDVSEWIDHRRGASLEPREMYVDEDSGLSYRPLRGAVDAALDADLIVYWGDFLHMAVYQTQTEDVLVRRIGACAPDEARELVARTFMLRGVDPGVRERAITFGSTLSMNSGADYASEYGADLTTLLRNVRGAWMRDPYSAQITRTLRESDQSHQCADAAFLLHDGSAHPRPRTGRLGVFIGRSKVRPEAVALFGRQLTQRLNLRARWIPWGEAPAFWPVNGRRRFRVTWPELEQRSDEWSRSDLLLTTVTALRGVRAPHPPTSARELIHGLTSYDVILTDTYHLAINAWAQGIPAVCLVDDGGPVWSVNSGDPDSRRDKRIDLYSQLDALGLIVKVDDLVGGSRAQSDRIAEYLETRGLLDVAFDRVSALRGQSSAAITSVFGRLRRAA
jgi:hypothetical protein